jgi:peptide/nickel transport system ATP-binding protein
VTTALQVEDLVVEYPTASGVRRTIDGLSFEVRRGEVLGIVGQSGAGKSILVRSLVNLVPPPGRIASGRVTVFGENFLEMSEDELRKRRGARVGVVIQNGHIYLNPLIRVGDQIVNVYRTHRAVRRREAVARVLEMLRDVGIPAPEERYRAYPHELSGGMAPRVLIAMALICSPELLIADEPTSGLDVTIQAQILRLFRRLVNESNAAGVLVSRDMGIVANFCDRIAVMDAGRAVEVAAIPEFFSIASHPMSRKLIAAASYSTVAAESVAGSMRADGAVTEREKQT